MADLQKTIKGLRCHSEPKFGPDEYFCETCPYDEATCGLDVPNDALSLLKAQEPRVMTLDEVKALPVESDVWVEITGAKGSKPRITATTIHGNGEKEIFGWLHTFNFAAYGKEIYGWRCWTSRPTDEQREATPWEN